jgi:hypothetical protein
MNNSSSRFTVDLAPGISNIPVEDIDGLGIDTSSLPNEQGIPGMPPLLPGLPHLLLLRLILIRVRKALPPLGKLVSM